MSAAEIKEVEETAIAKVSQESVSILDRVKALVVKDQESYNLATDLYKVALQVEKMADAAHDPVISHWHEKHKAACDDKKKDKELATQAKVLAKSKAAVWQDEQERIRQEQERKLREEAERQQREAERIAREEAERIRAEAARIEEEERLRLAAQAEQSGATAEQVNEILDTPLAEIPEVPVFTPAPFVAPTVAPNYQKASGFTARWSYSAKFNNLKELVKSAASNDHFLQYIQFNEQAINALARSSKDAFSLSGCALDRKRV
jgi:hypothetical protein